MSYENHDPERHTPAERVRRAGVSVAFTIRQRDGRLQVRTGGDLVAEFRGTTADALTCDYFHAVHVRDALMDAVRRAL